MIQSNASPSSFAAAYLVVAESLALPSLTAPLLRRAQVRLRETADTGNRRVFFVGPDALIGPFPGGPVCRSYGFTEALSETWRAGLGFAPSSAPVCALGHLPPRGKACGRPHVAAPTVAEISRAGG